MNNKINEIPEEEMTVDIELDNGETVECSIITIFEVDNKEYIALLPMVDEDDELYGNYWIYGYSENPDNVNEEPVLRPIEDEDEYEAALDAFDEYLDEQEFDEIIEEE